MTYTICMETYSEPKKCGEYASLDMARKKAVEYLNKHATKYLYHMYIYDTAVWKMPNKDPNKEYHIGYVELPYTGKPVKSLQPSFDGPMWWEAKGFGKGNIINPDGSLGRPFKLTRGGMYYTDVPKKKKTTKEWRPFGL